MVSSSSATAPLLSSARHYRDWVALLCTDQFIYMARQYQIWRLDLRNYQKYPLIGLPVHWLRQKAAGFWPLRRLGRLFPREFCQTPSGALLVALQKSIFRVNPTAQECRPVLPDTGGGRTRGFAINPQGHIFVGEYWGNPQRQPLRIWVSADDGQSWEVVCSLPGTNTKHIHNLTWDPYRQGIWILTGDAEGECALLFSRDEFQTITEIVRGGQIFRAVQIFCRPEGIYYGTDSERDQNWFVFLDVSSGEVRKIQPLPGSCIHATRMAGTFYISTAVEPSKVNHYPNAVLWSSPDLQSWSKVVEFKKDWLPGEYFGFGNIIFPRIQGECPVLVFSTLAIKHYDFTTFIITDKDSPISNKP